MKDRPKINARILADRIVGKANEGVAVICGVETKVLVDSGSMITLVSETFYNNLDPKPV